MTMRKKLLVPLLIAIVLLACSGIALATDKPIVATVDAGLGPCHADFTVKDGSGKPLYGVKIDIAIKYGFMNKREVDLDNATNSDGQARFNGLPNLPKKPLDFIITSGTVTKTITDDPTGDCNAAFNVTLSVH